MISYAQAKLWMSWQMQPEAMIGHSVGEYTAAATLVKTGLSALMMAGLDGIKNQIHPGEAMDKDLYDLPPEEEAEIPQVAFSLDQALEELDKDRDFLKAGGVFTDDVIDSYMALKQEEVERLRLATNPVEFELYYSC